LLFVNCIVGSRDGKLQLFLKLMRKGEQKPSPHVASRVIKGIRIIFENEARVCGEDYYFGPRDIHRDLQS
jgi:hypothetical protein